MGLPFKIMDSTIETEESSENPKNKTKHELVFIIAGKDKKSLNQLSSAKTSEDFGRAYGYPETSVISFEDKDKTMMAWELPDEIKQSDFYPFIMYRLSKENWQQEIELAKTWAETVRANSPQMFEEFSRFVKDANANTERDIKK